MDPQGDASVTKRTEMCFSKLNGISFKECTFIHYMRKCILNANTENPLNTVVHHINKNNVLSAPAEVIIHCITNAN